MATMTKLVQARVQGGEYVSIKEQEHTNSSDLTQSTRTNRNGLLTSI